MPEDKTQQVPVEPQEKVYSEREWKGLLSDKQRETQIRQELEGKLKSTEKEYSDLKADLEGIKAELLEKKEALTGDDEDVATIKQMKKIVVDLKKEVAKTKEELINMYTKRETEKALTEKEKKDRKSVEKARGKYTEEKAGKGLTFDEVLEGTRRMVEKNEAYKYLIANDPDPGEMMYNIGLQDSVIAERYKAYQKELTEGRVTSKAGLGGSTVPTGYYSQEYVKKMSKVPGWIKEHLKEIQESQKQWTKDIKK